MFNEQTAPLFFNEHIRVVRRYSVYFTYNETWEKGCIIISNLSSTDPGKGNCTKALQEFLKVAKGTNTKVFIKCRSTRSGRHGIEDDVLCARLKQSPYDIFTKRAVGVYERAGFKQTATSEYGIVSLEFNPEECVT